MVRMDDGWLNAVNGVTERKKNEIDLRVETETS